MVPKRIVAILAAGTLILGACSVAAGTPPSSEGPSAGPSVAPSIGPGGSLPLPSGGGAGLILRATLLDGFAPPSSTRTRLPIVSVYSDGRVMSEGATPAIYPGPLVEPVVVRTIGSTGAAGVLQAAAAAGLTGKDGAYGAAPALDAPSTVITVYHDGEVTTSTFSTLAPHAIGPASPVGDDSTVSATAQLLARLMGSDTFGGISGPGGTYVPLGYEVFAAPGAPAVSDPGLARAPVPWPLATPLARFGTADPLGVDGARTGVVAGADAATLGPVLGAATQITPFSSGGIQWTITVRPLLPDEVPTPGG